ncbi:MAG: TonB-dependent receptor [Gammaproteobacteria bacterium]|nr:MAG: TonB-dependent receptor [Gammaproteobacteria bacterium]
MHCRFSRILPAILAGLIPVNQAPALEQQDSILVTATRLDTDRVKARGNVTVITAADIRKSTARTLPELLGRETGVLTRSLYGNNATRATVDIRGFGATATQNTLILLDGRRLNDVDLSAVDYSAIPLESIERIEILRNSGSVLYGDGAVGGAINIITRQPGKAGTTAYAKAGAGNLETRTADARISHTDGTLSMFLGAHGIRSDGYRDNNDLRQRTLQSDLRYTGRNNEAFVKLYWDDQDLDLPGVRRVDPNTGLDELQDDRKGTGTPNDYADQRGYGITTGMTRYLDDGSEVVVDFGFRKKNQKAFFDDYLFAGAFANYLDSDLKTWSATPRMVIPHTLAGISMQTITGIDYYHSQYDSDRALNPDTRNDPVHRLDITQKTSSAYLDTTLSPAESLHFNLGARLERVKIKAEDDVDTTAPGGGFASEAPDYDQTDWIYMLEAGAEQQVRPHTAVYLKATRSARVATVDELFEIDPVTFLQVFSQLDPQTAKGVDTGMRYDTDRLSGQANVYYMWLEDEIHFDPNTFANINLDPTKRYGVEVNGRISVLEQLDLQASYTHMRAEFRDGPFDGNDIPLVPRNTASASATWRWTPDTELTAAVNFVGERYFDNDQTNDFGKKIPSYETIDLQASHRYRGFRVTAKVNNLLDKKYYDYGVRSTFTPGVYNAFPLPERTFLVTVAKEFGNRK